jgi:hypothetical protein
MTNSLFQEVGSQTVISSRGIAEHMERKEGGTKEAKSAALGVFGEERLRMW